jgi:hypothetical protein
MAFFRRMGLLIDYYLAGSDESAVTLGAEPESASGVMSGNGIEPVVMLSTLENLLTGLSEDEIAERGGGEIVGISDSGAMVVRVRDQLLEAVAGADAPRLRTAAASWIESEELAGTSDLDTACSWLDGFRGLAIQARETGLRVYSVMSL